MKIPLLKSFTDQLNKEVQINFPPKRIISLVPSQTELLHYLGLEKEVAGITKFCIHPKEWFQTKTRIGGTKQFDFKKIAALKPDLIIGNKEENEEKQIKELMKEYPVWMSDIRSLDDALDMIERVGKVVDKKEKAVELKNEIHRKFLHFPSPISHLPSFKVAYFIWKEPMMVVGRDTFINDILKRCGWENIASPPNPLSKREEERYPQISIEELQNANPDLILLSSEPFPFKEKHIPEFQTICPNAKILLVDGEMFSWYGSRLLKSVEYLKKLIATTSL